jgi:hypothetical protein
LLRAHRDRPVPITRRSRILLTLRCMEHARRHAPATAAAGVIVAIMIVGAVSMWTVIPFGWIWIGSKLSSSQEPSGGPYMVVFFGIVASICAVAYLLAWLSRIYVRLTGTNRLPQRYVPGWRKSLSDERAGTRGLSGMTVLEGVILASVLLAALAMAAWFFVLAGSPLPNQ